MAAVPTPEESGRKILAIYKQDGIRANEMLQWQSLNSRLILDPQWRAKDFEAGLEWCVGKGFLRLDQQKSNMYFLTEAGFVEL